DILTECTMIIRAIQIFTFPLFISSASYSLQGCDTVRVKGPRTFGIDCMHCNTTASWTVLRRDIEFDHKLTGYALRCNHANVACSSCHSGVPMSELKTACSSCHEDQHKGELGDKCGDCHTPSGWRSPNEAVRKHQLTRFPLLGSHALAD